MLFVFTGEMMTMSREAAMEVVEYQGGMTAKSVSKKTNYLVISEAALAAFENKRETTGKLARTLAILAEGGAIEIVDEFMFIDMIT
jgi:NAD-dependent DNA ligase